MSRLQSTFFSPTTRVRVAIRSRSFASLLTIFGFCKLLIVSKVTTAKVNPQRFLPNTISALMGVRFTRHQFLPPPLSIPHSHPKTQHNNITTATYMAHRLIKHTLKLIVVHINLSNIIRVRRTSQLIIAGRLPLSLMSKNFPELQRYFRLIN